MTCYIDNKLFLNLHFPFNTCKRIYIIYVLQNDVQCNNKCVINHKNTHTQQS